MDKVATILPAILFMDDDKIPSFLTNNQIFFWSHRTICDFYSTSGGSLMLTKDACAVACSGKLLEFIVYA